MTKPKPEGLGPQYQESPGGKFKAGNPGMPMTAAVKERWEAWFDMVSKGVRRYTALKACGLDYHAYRIRRERDPEFRKREAAAESASLEGVEDALWAAATKGNMMAIMFLLQNRDPERWQDRRGKVTHEHVGRVEIEAGARLERIGELMEALAERRALASGAVVDAEVVETRELGGG